MVNVLSDSGRGSCNYCSSVMAVMNPLKYASKEYGI